MLKRKIEYPKIDEVIHAYEHPSGLKVFVIPKKGYSKKYAAFAVNYGSMNNAFVIPGESDAVTVPDGIAHFLEHKLFEQKDGSVMDKFSALGASPNAYTGFSQTVYLFSCTDRFSENFRLLLDYVQNPYITEESVEKEKGIIGQEIRMYEDDPNWRCFFNLLRALYRKHPVRMDIAGTVDSIAKINKDLLYTCYKTFYSPSNMVLIVTGDVEPEEIFAGTDAGIAAEEKPAGIERLFPEEGMELHQSYIEEKLAVSAPIFQLGFKDQKPLKTGMELLIQEITGKLLLELLVGKSSVLYGRLYAQGLINHTFEFDYSVDANYAFSLMGGESGDPQQVRRLVEEETGSIKQNGLDEAAFERIRRAMKGKYLKQLNSVERISNLFVSVYFKDANVFDYYDAYDKITFEYATQRFKEHFSADSAALSVVMPV